MKPTVSRKCIVARPLIELVEELKAKINLLKGHQNTDYESTIRKMTANKEKIAALRMEIRNLRISCQEKHHKDSSVISQAFQNRPVDKTAFNSKTTEIAVEEYDFRVSAAMKRYNQAKYLTASKKKKLKQLKMEFADAQSALSHDITDSAKKTRQLQTIRDLENRVDKLELKGNECEFIQKTYEAIYKRLYDEHTRCNNTLDDMESDIVRCRMENSELRQTHKQAETSLAASQKQLAKQEELAKANRKRYEIETARLRKVVDDQMKSHERRGSKVSEAGDETTVEDTEKSLLDMLVTFDEAPGVLEETKTEMIEERIEKLRQVTGIGDLKNTVAKFAQQLVVKKKLVDLINKMENHIERLHKDCAHRESNLNNVKKSMKTHAEYVREEVESKSSKVHENIKEEHAVMEQFEDASVILAHAKAGLEHIVEKMTSVKLPERDITPKPASQVEYMDELLEFIELKVEVLLHELDDHDVNSLLEKMRNEEKMLLYANNELKEQVIKKLPSYNDRVMKPEECLAHIENAAESDSGSDNSTFSNRLEMKRNSHEVIEAKLKRPSGKGKQRK